MSRAKVLIKQVGAPLFWLIGYFAGAVLFSLFLGNAIIAMIALGLAFPLVAFGLRRDVFARPENRAHRDAVFFLFCGCFFLWLSTQVFGNFFLSRFADAGYEEYAETMSSVHVLIRLFFIIAISPVSEEILFRGIIFGGFSKAMPKWLACALSSFMFAFVHGTAVHMIIGFAFGVFLCYAYDVTRSILSVIGLHLFYNLLTSFLSGLMWPVVLGSAFWVMVVCFLAFAASFGFCVLTHKYHGLFAKS